MAKRRRDTKGQTLHDGESQQSDGYYRYQYVDTRDGKRKCFRARTLVDLREKEKELLKAQMDDIKYREAATATLNIVFDRHMQTKINLKESTATNYIYMYNRFVRETFGTRLVSSIKYSDVLRLYNHLLKDKGLQINTLDILHCALHPAFTMAVRDDIIRHNPSDGIMADLKRNFDYKVGIRHALTLDQQRSFLRFCKTSSEYHRWYPLLTVILGTGCRIGEIVGLRWVDVDMDERVININHSMSYHSRRTKDQKNRCFFKVSTPKTKAGYRDIPMMDAVYNALVEERKYQQRHGFCTDIVDGMSGFIFQNRYHTIHNPHGINKELEKMRIAHNQAEIACAKVEHREPVIVPHFTCHHLRHTFCTRFCEQETNIKVIQTIMGHADIETTMNIYAEATKEKQTESIKMLSAKLDIF